MTGRYMYLQVQLGYERAAGAAEAMWHLSISYDDPDYVSSKSV